MSDILEEARRAAMRQVIHNIQQHRVTAQSIDGLHIESLSDDAIESLYNRVLQGERAIHESVTTVELLREEVNANMSEDQNAEQQVKTETTVTTPGESGGAQEGTEQPVSPGGTNQSSAPLGAEGEPTAAEQQDPNVATPKPDEA